MNQRLALIALVVRDYDEAIDFYTRILKFNLVEDSTMSGTKRWVVVSPPGTSGCNLLLAKAATDEQASRIGNQTGGRVFLFLHTDNFQRDFDNLKANQVKIIRGPIMEPYGTVAVFADLYGNLWDLIEPVKTDLT
jgi:catechol 2,3-dioxygenase-like lactoylglutathione lyase family enzyme